MWQAPGVPSGNQTTTTEGNGSAVSQGANEFATDLVRLLNEYLGLSPLLSKFVLTLLVIAVTWYAYKLVPKVLGRRVRRRFHRPSVARSILRVIQGVVVIIGLLFIIVGPLGAVDIGNVFLSIGVLSAIVAIVLAPLAGSFISGMLVLANQPYEVGDMVELVDEERQGFVEDITFSHTKIFTLENTFLVIPNEQMRNRDVINYSAEDPRSRMNLDIGITYESDVEEARSRIEEATRSVDSVVEGGPPIRIGSERYPAAPTCYIDAFGGSSIQLTLRYWIEEPHKLHRIRSEVLAAITERIEDSDVEIAYPHTHLVFDETSGHLSVSDESADRAEPRLGARPPAED